MGFKSSTGSRRWPLCLFATVSTIAVGASCGEDPGAQATLDTVESNEVPESQQAATSITCEVRAQTNWNTNFWDHPFGFLTNQVSRCNARNNNSFPRTETQGSVQACMDRAEDWARACKNPGVRFHTVATNGGSNSRYHPQSEAFWTACEIEMYDDTCPDVPSWNGRTRSVSASSESACRREVVDDLVRCDARGTTARARFYSGGNYVTFFEAKGYRFETVRVVANSSLADCGSCEASKVGQQCRTPNIVTISQPPYYVRDGWREQRCLAPGVP